jgi:hypothetical protein
MSESEMEKSQVELLQQLALKSYIPFLTVITSLTVCMQSNNRKNLAQQPLKGSSSVRRST